MQEPPAPPPKMTELERNVLAANIRELAEKLNILLAKAATEEIEADVTVRTRESLGRVDQTNIVVELYHRL